MGLARGVAKTLATKPRAATNVNLMVTGFQIKDEQQMKASLKCLWSRARDQHAAGPRFMVDA